MLYELREWESNEWIESISFSLEFLLGGSLFLELQRTIPFLSIGAFIFDPLPAKMELEMEILLFDCIGDDDAFWWILCTEKPFRVNLISEAAKLPEAALALRGQALSCWLWLSQYIPQTNGIRSPLLLFGGSSLNGDPFYQYWRFILELSNSYLLLPPVMGDYSTCDKPSEVTNHF